MPGKYFILVNALWNPTAAKDVRYKDVVIDIYAPTKVDINLVDEEEGHETFSKCLKNLA
jgi:hypothetical protein